ncbi:MAG: hypothetical protein M0Z94_02470 [Dehalococcoidales bacterium]|nr:hypothetical protein [Dehalococcoidales bacterium]
MAVDFDRLRRQLAALEWGKGLTRDGIRLRYRELPEEVYLHLPSEKAFRSAEEVVVYTERALRRAQELDMPPEGAAEEGGPEGWGDSPAAEIVERPDMGHGVGSGANPGYTGGGSAQTGVGREGTTYGDEHSEPLPD